MEVLGDLDKGCFLEHWGERLVGVNLRENGRRRHGNQKCKRKELCMPSKGQRIRLWGGKRSGKVTRERGEGEISGVISLRRQKGMSSSRA